MDFHPLFCLTCRICRGKLAASDPAVDGARAFDSSFLLWISPKEGVHHHFLSVHAMAQMVLEGAG